MAKADALATGSAALESSGGTSRDPRRADDFEAGFRALIAPLREAVVLIDPIGTALRHASAGARALLECADGPAAATSLLDLADGDEQRGVLLKSVARAVEMGRARFSWRMRSMRGAVHSVTAPHPACSRALRRLSTRRLAKAMCAAKSVVHSRGGSRAISIPHGGD
jgi:hypothetical protein